MEYTYHTTSVRQDLLQSTEYVLIPIVELVRRWLFEQDALHPGQIIQTSIRQISEAIGAGRRAWGSITPALKRLEDDELIERLSSRCGTLIQVRHSQGAQGDRPSDHMHNDDQGDRPSDHVILPEYNLAEPSSASPSVSPTDRGDRPSDHLEYPEAGDRRADHLACIEGTRAHACALPRIPIQEEEESASPVANSSTEPNAPSDSRYADLRAIGIEQEPTLEILVMQPDDGWTAADIIRERERAARENRGFGYVINTWRRGRRLYQKEATHDYTTPPASGASARADQQPQSVRSYLDDDTTSAERYGHVERLTTSDLGSSGNNRGMPQVQLPSYAL